MTFLFESLEHLMLLQITSRVLVVVGVLTALSCDTAVAQFTGPTTPPNVPLPTSPATSGGTQQNASAKTVQQMMMLRYLQQRSGGGVKRGTPQFIPFGNSGFVPQGMPAQQDSTQDASSASSNKKSAEEKKAEYQAAREEKKKAARERAEKRKAARAQGTTTTGSKDPA